MKKSLLSILTAAIALCPLTAFAQDAQTNIQSNTNSAAGVGNANLILQNAHQASQQQQLNLDAYGIPATPSTQTSVQGNTNAGATIGNYNTIGQNATQNSTQGQIDVNQYLPANLPH
ncbi:hypothetical protein NIES4102_35780 [Chondrocystis sp. NIES-4102]|nr:hypothetical protein NIES4102_35780 [Chondrocystis sp. NIES-4102]